MILSRILNKVYGLDRSAPNRRRKNLTKLAEELQQWFRTLPPSMQFNHDEANDNTTPPDVLVLHMQYWSAILMLYRKL